MFLEKLNKFLEKFFFYEGTPTFYYIPRKSGLCELPC